MAYIYRSRGRLKTILNGQGEAGHRAAPARGGNHDARIGCRIDFGPKFANAGKEYRRYNLQLNSNAQDPHLKKMAAQDPHKVYSTADVEIKVDRTEEEEDEAIEDFKDQMINNLKE
ncbi:hypothetical protein PMG11_03169 [Penicillium brasilianum]|uniref:Uncharacterized protein n=1 Tax=Penicillium brasilianum TaxID=104259 RepID=A0A0F7VEU8_PENBI|nr:hypothetical protein PMG11_03169 [Penicillium brasilianum]